MVVQNLNLRSTTVVVQQWDTKYKAFMKRPTLQPCSQLPGAGRCGRCGRTLLSDMGGGDGWSHPDLNARDWFGNRKLTYTITFRLIIGEIARFVCRICTRIQMNVHLAALKDCEERPGSPALRKSLQLALHGADHLRECVLHREGHRCIERLQNSQSPDYHRKDQNSFNKHLMLDLAGGPGPQAWQ